MYRASRSKFRITTILLALLCSMGSVYAQLPRMEFGFTYGLSNFLGDLGGNAGRGGYFLKDAQLSLTKTLTGLYAAYRPSELINIQIAVNAGRVGSADSLIKATGGLEEARKRRNQHFRSSIGEAYLALEIFPTVLFEYDPNDVYHHIHPYFLLGIGAIRYNPQAQYIRDDGTAQWVDLRPLRTEGQGMPNYPDRKEYGNTTITIPHGVGIKYFVNSNLGLALEMVIRKTFTDYIDDVSTRYIAKEDFEAFFGAGSEQAKIAFQMSNKAAFANGGNYVLGYGPGAQRGNPDNDTFFSLNFRVSYRIGGLKWVGRKFWRPGMSNGFLESPFNSIQFDTTQSAFFRAHLGQLLLQLRFQEPSRMALLHFDQPFGSTLIQ